MRSIYLLVKAKERQNDTGRQGAGPGRLKGRGNERGGGQVGDDMCVCANLYKYHNKKLDVAAQEVGAGRWCSGLLGFLFLLFLFFVCVVI